MPRAPKISLYSSTLTEWTPGRHYLWGTYDVTPRPSLWQRLCCTAATRSFRLRVDELAAALDVRDRGRFMGAEMSLRGAAHRWAVRLGGAAADSWFDEDFSVHVSCHYSTERPDADFYIGLEGAPELMESMVRFIELANTLLSVPAPASGAQLGVAANIGATMRRQLSQQVADGFCKLVEEIMEVAGKVRAEDAARALAEYGGRSSGR